MSAKKTIPSDTAPKKEEYVQVIIARPENITGDSETAVSVNGKIYQIQYDKPVMVPVSVAEIIEQSRMLQAEIAEITAKASMKPGKAAIAEL